ncbi:MAG: hypothetical protein ACOY93_08680 [Bacillota bacterium]
MPAAVDQLVKNLMALPARERIPRCEEILSGNELDPDGRSRIAYVLAHAQRAESRPAEAMQTCQAALSRDMSDARRSVLMQCLALCQYDLGLMTELPATLDDWERLPMPGVLRAYWLMLKGRVLLRHRDPSALPLFAEAEELFADPDQAQSRAWAQLSTARLCWLLGDLDEAERALGRVTYAPYIPKARLLQAEVTVTRGDVTTAEELVRAVRAGHYGPLDRVDEARSRYVEALCALHNGAQWSAALLAEEARKLAVTSSMKDLELIDAITALRVRIAG